MLHRFETLQSLRSLRILINFASGWNGRWENRARSCTGHCTTRNESLICRLRREKRIPCLPNLCFLEGHNSAFVDACFEQALAVCPVDSDVIFAAGMHQSDLRRYCRGNGNLEASLAG